VEILVIQNKEKIPIAGVLTFFFKDQILPYYAGSLFEYSPYICNPRSQDFLEVVQNGLRKGDGKVKKNSAVKKSTFTK
jgi:hypothetical protein